MCAIAEKRAFLRLCWGQAKLSELTEVGNADSTRD
jgi:hypothetical protein